MSGTLYIVPTPVGNLADMTPRAVEVLKAASLILAEDTRTSAVLMRHFGITTPMSSHHKFNEHDSLEPVLSRLEAGEDVALVSDAGTPGISDPGFMLSREAAHLAEACGPERPAAVCREISKLHETTHRGTLGELSAFFAANQARGEIVIIVAGKDRERSRVHRNKYRSEPEE